VRIPRSECREAKAPALSEGELGVLLENQPTPVLARRGAKRAGEVSAVPFAAHPGQSWVREETREGPGPAESRRPPIRASRSWASLRTAATCSRQW